MPLAFAEKKQKDGSCMPAFEADEQMQKRLGLAGETFGSGLGLMAPGLACMLMYALRWRCCSFSYSQIRKSGRMSGFAWFARPAAHIDMHVKRSPNEGLALAFRRDDKPA